MPEAEGVSGVHHVPAGTVLRSRSDVDETRPAGTVGSVGPSAEPARQPVAGLTVSAIEQVQRKSTITTTPIEKGAKTPLAVLSEEFGKYFKKKSLQESYTFHGLKSVAADDKRYAGTWDRAGRADAVVDPASATKADSKNRDNTVIGPYGHFGVMERSIFGRQDLGNTYDGGHLVEHTLMEGQDADVHGNLAPQENKSFNQGLMRGWEAVPETLMSHGLAKGETFNYKVRVGYEGNTYTRTGDQLVAAQVINPAMVAQLDGPDQAALKATTVSFPRWVPTEWKATVSAAAGTKLPSVSLNSKPSQFQHLKPTQQAALDHVTFDDPLLPALKRRNSGTLAGFIEGMGSMGAGSMYLLNTAEKFRARMYQPEPMDGSLQPAGVPLSGVVPTPLPVVSVATSVLPPATPVSAAAFFADVDALPQLKNYETRVKTSSSYKAIKSIKSGKGSVLGRKNGHKLVVSMKRWREANPTKKANKAALIAAVQQSLLNKAEKGLLLQLEYDPMLTD